MLFSSIEERNAAKLKQIQDFKNKPINTRLQFWIFIAAAITFLFFIGSMLFQIVTGIFALIVSIIGIAFLLFLVKAIREATPAAQQKLKNLKLAIMVKEARESSIEQLQNKILDDTKALEERKKSLNKLGAALETLRLKIRDAKEGSAARATMEAQLTKMEPSYGQFKSYIKSQQQQLALYEEKVKEARQLDDFNKIVGEFMDTFESASDDKLQEMLSLEAFSSIETQFTENSIAIENLMLDMETK